jgi:hypothetical protein
MIVRRAVQMDFATAAVAASVAALAKVIGAGVFGAMDADPG